MSTKFKVGDKVRCIVNNPNFQIRRDNIYTVKKIIVKEVFTQVYLEEFPDRFYLDSRFELVEEPKYAYSYGGSALAAQRPLTMERILNLVNEKTTDADKFEIFELVPVKPVVNNPQPVVFNGLERK
jgi:hypothetical protein